MKLDLKDVTVCAVDSVNMDLAARALDRCVAQCDFADAFLFSHAPVAGAFRAVKIDKIGSTTAYANFLFKQLPRLVETPFILIVQWDGYVIDANAWSPRFRDYDYIGARWPWLNDGMSVGNGGFSLRSRKLMSALSEPRFPVVENIASDVLVCRAYRPDLERDYGIRYAPEAVADLFSYETTAPSAYTKPVAPTFGFHGMGNMWRYVDDTEMMSSIDRLSPYVYQTLPYAQLIVTYFRLGRFELAAALYLKMKAHLETAAILHIFRTAVRDDGDLAQRCVRACERLMRPSRSGRWLAAKSMRVRRKASLHMARALGRKSPFEV